MSNPVSMHLKFAIPVKDEVVSEHFGYSRAFCFIEVINRQITANTIIANPMHDRGLIPSWLAENKVTHVFANGIGQKAIDLLTENKIEVIWGVPADKPELLVKAYLDSQLVPGVNLRDH